MSKDLILNKIYKLHVELLTTMASESYYRYIFNTNFNLRFRRPNSDTCNKYDSLQNIISHSQDEEQIKAAKLEKEVHQKKAEKVITSRKIQRSFEHE